MSGQVGGNNQIPVDTTSINQTERPRSKAIRGKDSSGRAVEVLNRPKEEGSVPTTGWQRAVPTTERTFKTCVNRTGLTKGDAPPPLINTGKSDESAKVRIPEIKNRNAKSNLDKINSIIKDVEKVESSIKGAYYALAEPLIGTSLEKTTPKTFRKNFEDDIKSLKTSLDKVAKSFKENEKSKIDKTESESISDNLSSLKNDLKKYTEVRTRFAKEPEMKKLSSNLRSDKWANANVQRDYSRQTDMRSTTNKKVSEAVESVNTFIDNAINTLKSLEGK